jgi:Phosphate-starvation-inducible E family
MRPGALSRPRASPPITSSCLRLGRQSRKRRSICVPDGVVGTAWGAAEDATLAAASGVPTPQLGATRADEPAPSRRQLTVRRRRERPLLGILGWAEDFVHFAVAVVLLAVALMVLYRTAYDLATTGPPFATAATSAVNGVLFAIIVMEVMRTVVSHFETGGLQLQPFLIIGIVSAVREVLTVGAKLPFRAPSMNQAPRSSTTPCLSWGSTPQSCLG